jgi:hypothetical protein
MIALLLAAQLSAEIGRLTPMDAQTAPRGEAAASSRLTPDGPGLTPRVRSGGHCPMAGQLEASTQEPVALYRKGDRPAKGFRKWTSYPEPQLCLIGDEP